MPQDRLSPEERTLRSTLAAQTRWAREDACEGTKKARDAFLDSFINQVDPDRVLPKAERDRRAESLRKAHFTKMALASARSRRRDS